ncbi:MAG: integrin alpha, partial [Candidatus Thorarchaeota archaeon]
MEIKKNLRVLIILFLIASVTISFTSYLSNSSNIVQGNFFQEGQGHAITGTRNGGALGVHFDGIGDVNGDGIDDFIVGEPWGSQGTMYLFYGQLDASWNELTTADAQASFVGGIGDNDWVGRWTAGLGDIDGNGYADFALSAIFDHDVGFREGKVHVFLGGSDVSWTMGMSVSQADVTITGEANDDSIGHGVYGIGDTNDDGYDDFLVSSFSDEGGLDAGQLYLFLGRPAGQWLSTYSAADANASWIGAPEELLSIDASGIGDVNNDGFSDFAVGAWTQSDTVSHRTVYVILGNDTNNWSMDQPITASNASFVGRNDTGLSEMEWFLDWISGAGDVNGD